MGERHTFTTTDLSRRSGDVIAEAMRRPVTITQRNRPRLVIMSIADFERLNALADPRQAGTIETLPDALAHEIAAAIEAYAEDDEAGPA
jgi:prevent-host-death family protein